MTLKTALLSILTVMLASLPVPGQGVLDDAWRDYDYQNFSAATLLFKKIILDINSTPDQRLVARIGQAMVVQCTFPGGDPQRAVHLYRAILDSIGPEHALRPNILLAIGRSYAAYKKPDLDSARITFEEINARYPGTLEAHEAALERAYILSYRQTREDFLRSIKFLDEYCAANPKNPLESTMQMFSANLAVLMRDYALSREHLIIADSLGIVNVMRKPLVICQIAYFSDKILRDPVTARKYYHKLLDHYPTNGRSYYCRMRLQALGEKPQ